MHKSASSKSSRNTQSHSSSPSSNSGGIFSNLKKLTGNNNSNGNGSTGTGSKIDTSDISYPRSISVPTAVDNNSKPLSKHSTLNTSNLSQYIDNTNGYNHSSSNISITSPSKHSFSRRSSQVSGSFGKLSRQQTNQSLTSSISSITMPILNRFLATDGSLNLERPTDPYEIDELYQFILQKRNIYHSVPAQGQKELMNYDLDKKWLIIKQDLQAEYKRMKRVKQSLHGMYSGNTPITSDHFTKSQVNISNHNQNFYDLSHQSTNTTLSNSPDISHFAPDYYVRKIISNQITTKQLNNLWVSLRTEKLDWVIGFINAQGQVAIANVLLKFMQRKNLDILMDDDALERETAYFNCLRVLTNLREGMREALKTRLVISAVVEGLFSMKLSSRRVATETLVYMVAEDELKRANRDLDAFFPVLNALDQESSYSANVHLRCRAVESAKRNSIVIEPFSEDQVAKKMEQWLYVVEYTLDGRGKMGSLVGASDEYKNVGGENAVLEYLLYTMILVNLLCSRNDDVKQRNLLRSRLKNYGLSRLIKKMELLKYPLLNNEIRKFEDGTLDDYASLMSSKSMDKSVDMSNPISLLKSLWNSYEGTDAEKHLLSLIQHLFLSNSKTLEENSDPAEASKQLKLIDSLVSNVAFSSMDTESSFNGAIQRLYDAMQTDEVARRAILEARELTKRLEEIKAERDYLTEKLSKAENGLVGQLQSELQQRDRILQKNQRVTEQLQDELEQLKKKHLLQKHEHEVELRKMLTIINSKPQDTTPSELSIGKNNPPLNSAKRMAIQRTLQDRLQQTKDALSSESKRLGTTLGSNRRLRMLRSRMEDIENEARELEMTNFAESNKQVDKSRNSTRKSDNFDTSKLFNDIKVQKLGELRQRLASIQQESNEISKFNIEARVNEMFIDKKLSALERLKDLETKYKDFGITFEDDPEFAGLINNLKLDEGKDIHFSLDPKQLENVIIEMNKVVDELNKIKDSSKDVLIDEKDSLSSDTDNEEEETESELSTQPDSVSSGTFLESLSQKYATGQNSSTLLSDRRLAIDSNTDHSINGCRKKEFVSRLKKSTTVNSAPFLDELSQKVSLGAPISLKNFQTLESENSFEVVESNPNIAAEITLDGHSSKSSSDIHTSIEIDSDVPEGNSEPALPTIQIETNPPIAPILPSFLQDFKDEITKSNLDSMSSSSPFTQSVNLESDIAISLVAPLSDTHSLTPISPFIPPPQTFLSGGTSSPPPPPPPPPPIGGPKLMYRSAGPSPLLSHPPSLFEKYPRPKKKLKQLHWEKIEDPGDSIWKNARAEQFADDLYEKGVLSQLERVFAARDVKFLTGRNRDEPSKISFLSRDISQQFGINLHMYSSLSVSEVVMKILKCEKSFLDTSSVIDFLSKSEIIEITNNLARNFTPYTTDWEGISKIEDAKTPEKDPDELQRADQIYLHLIVNLQMYWASRMRALKVITTYQKEYNDLVTKLRKIDAAIGAIQKSDNLRNIFDVILAVGNYMNDSSKQAHGFKLSTLQRLTFMKDEKNSMTFLNYVERIVRTNYPAFNEFLKELEPVLNVVKISIEQLSNDCEEFCQNVSNVERSIEIGNLSDSSKFHPSDRVLTKVLPILPEARSKADLLDDEMKLTMMEFKSLMKLFGEDSSDKFSKNSFFQKFSDFINEYKKAQDYNIKLEVEEKAYERRKKMVEEQQQKSQDKKSSQSLSDGAEADSSSGDDRDVMDKLLEKLKNAAPGKADPSSARKRALARKRLMEEKIAEQTILDHVEINADEVDRNPSSCSSPDIKDEGKLDLTISPTPQPRSMKLSNSSINLKLSVTEVEEDELGDRARNLLMELRGGDQSIKKSMEHSDSNERIRRNRNRKPQDTSSGSNVLHFVGQDDLKADVDVKEIDDHDILGEKVENISYSKSHEDIKA